MDTARGAVLSDTATAWLPEQPLISLTMGRKTARVVSVDAVTGQAMRFAAPA